MISRIGVAALVLLATPVAAQSPAGWMVRADRSTSASDPDAAGAIRFVSMGTGFHATNPQAAVYWHPANEATGSYALAATFTQTEPSSHVNYYGLVFGGRALAGPEQNYLYFLVGQDGSFLVKHRAGDETTHTLVPRTQHEAVARLDDAGRATNALEVRVGAGTVEFVVNGTVVHSASKSGMLAGTDGIYGLRVNHRLDVHIDGFGVTRP